jgi:hypothetical protein
MSQLLKRKQHKEREKQRGYTSFGRSMPVAQRLRTTLRYSERIVGTGLPALDYQFNLNSLFDPNFTGTGHQPKGFDQLSALYGRYRVYHTRWHIQFAVIPAVNYPTYLGVAPTNSVTGFTDVGDHAETAYAQHLVTAYGSINNGTSIKGGIDLAKLNGKTHEAYAADDTTQAVVTASPTEQLMLHMFMCTMDGTTNLGVWALVTLEFDCEFTDPVQLAQS